MNGRGDPRFDRAFRRSALPPVQGAVIRLTGLACLVFAGAAFWEGRDASSPLLLAALVLAVIVGAVLLALPSFIQFQLALYYTRPLPDGIERAFETLYEDLRGLSRALEDLREDVDALPVSRGAMEEREEEFRRAVGEIEEALARVHLAQEELRSRTDGLTADFEEGSGPPLPGDLVKRAAETRQKPGGTNPIIRSGKRPG